MIPRDWIEHRRGDRERVGWIVPDGKLFVAVDLLGRVRTPRPVEWLDAEELLDGLGIAYLAERYTLTVADGRERPVRIGEVTTDSVDVIADDFGAASAVGSAPERIRLPFPAPRELRQIG